MFVHDMHEYFGVSVGAFHIMDDCAGLVRVVFAYALSGYCNLASHCPTMPVVQVTVHPRGPHPLEAARALHLREEEGMTLKESLQKPMKT